MSFSAGSHPHTSSTTTGGPPFPHPIPPIKRSTQNKSSSSQNKSKLTRLSRTSRTFSRSSSSEDSGETPTSPHAANLDIFYCRQLAVTLKDQALQQKIDHEIRMRDGTAKLLAASKHPQQMLEAAKNLLTSNQRMMSYMGELQRRKTHEVLKREFPDEGNQVPCKARISVSDLRVPLMWKDAEHFRSKGDHRRYAAFCLVKIGTEIYDTALLKDIDRTMTDLAFDDVICFSDIPQDFECHLEVYCHRCQDDLSVVSTPKRIRKKIEDFGNSVGRSVGRRLSGLKDDSDPNMIIGPKFECLGKATLKLADVTDSVGTFTLTLESDISSMELPLFGNICCRLAAQPYCLIQDTVSGLLHLQDPTSLAWSPYWCRLRNLSISCWRTQQESATHHPAVTIPVTKTTQISEVPVSLCQRNHCIQLSSQTFSGRESYNIAACDQDDKVRWWDGIYQHLLDQVMWLQACESVMNIRTVTPRRHSVYRRKGLSMYDDMSTSDSSSPMTKMLNRLNIPEKTLEEPSEEKETSTEPEDTKVKVTQDATTSDTKDKETKVTQDNGDDIVESKVPDVKVKETSDSKDMDVKVKDTCNSKVMDSNMEDTDDCKVTDVIVKDTRIDDVDDKFADKSMVTETGEKKIDNSETTEVKDLDDSNVRDVQLKDKENSSLKNDDGSNDNESSKVQNVNSDNVSDVSAESVEDTKELAAGEVSSQDNQGNVETAQEVQDEDIDESLHKDIEDTGIVETEELRNSAEDIEVTKGDEQAPEKEVNEEMRSEAENQDNLNEAEKQGDLNEAENKDNLNEAEKQGDLNEAENQGDLNEAEKQGDLNEAENKDNLNEAEEQGDLNEAEKQGDLNEAEKQGDLNEAENQGDLNEAENQGDLNEAEKHGDLHEAAQEKEATTETVITAKEEKSEINAEHQETISSKEDSNTAEQNGKEVSPISDNKSKDKSVLEEDGNDVEQGEMVIPEPQTKTETNETEQTSLQETEQSQVSASVSVPVDMDVCNVNTGSELQEDDKDKESEEISPTKISEDASENVNAPENDEKVDCDVVVADPEPCKEKNSDVPSVPEVAEPQQPQPDMESNSNHEKDSSTDESSELLSGNKADDSVKPKDDSESSEFSSELTGQDQETLQKPAEEVLEKVNDESGDSTSQENQTEVEAKAASASTEESTESAASQPDSDSDCKFGEAEPDVMEMKELNSEGIDATHHSDDQNCKSENTASLNSKNGNKESIVPTGSLDDNQNHAVEDSEDKHKEDKDNGNICSSDQEPDKSPLEDDGGDEATGSDKDDSDTTNVANVNGSGDLNANKDDEKSAPQTPKTPNGQQANGAVGGGKGSTPSSSGKKGRKRNRNKNRRKNQGAKRGGNKETSV